MRQMEASTSTLILGKASLRDGGEYWFAPDLGGATRGAAGGIGRVIM